MTSQQVLGHLQQRLPLFEAKAEPQPCTGGYLNEVWRVIGKPAPVIVKIAPPFIATAPDIPLDPGRILYEARSLNRLGPDGEVANVATDFIRPPHLIDFDEANHVLVMEDVGEQPDLAVWLNQGERSLIRGMGQELGGFIGRLHRASMGNAKLAQQFNNLPIQQTRHAVQYQAIEALCHRAGFEDANVLGTKAVALGERFQQLGRCLIQGDLWPRSILVAEAGLRVIDWEFAHYGHPAQDLGHFAAHLWMLKHQAPSHAIAVRVETLLNDFLEAYANALGDARKTLLDEEGLQDCAVHFGAEILMRTVGVFQDGYLYEGLSPDSPIIQEAVDVAAIHLRSPDGVSTFARLTWDDMP